MSRGESTRSRILLAAAEGFGTHGYHRTSVADISREAGVTGGALYFHFDSKEQLAAAVLELEDDIWPALAMAVRVRERSGLRGLVEFSYEAACRMAHDPVARAGFRLRVEGEPDGEGTHGAELRWLSLVTEFLALAQRQREIRADLLPVDIAHVFVEALTGMRLLSLAVEGADLDRRLRRLWDALLRMVLAEGSTISFRPPREVPAACPPGRPEDDRAHPARPLGRTTARKHEP
ncbi:ScbR family autoregulator-binding transcription factor [Streptomyces rubradiris]|uniref:ScbR family autoregulator-binding transcription factor n=1 Tax=Streptomyces rubradiris TaxID=285531 RepID=UPI00227D8C20